MPRPGYRTKPQYNFSRTPERPLERKPQRFCRSCDNKVLGKKTRCWDCEGIEDDTRKRLYDRRIER